MPRVITDLIGIQYLDVTYFTTLILVSVVLYWSYLLLLGILLLVLTSCFCIRKKQTKQLLDVNGQGVLITGCDTGIGYTLARKLDRLGFTVYAGCLRGTSDLRKHASKRLHVIQLDVTSDDSVSKALDYVSAHSTKTKCGVWGLVNNAGVNHIGDVEFCTMEMYRRILEVNILGMVRVTKAFLPLIRKSEGRFVNVTSVQGRLPMPSHSVYGITKFGGENFSDALRLEMIKFGVKVSLIEPGNFGGATGMLNEASLRIMRRDFDIMWEEAPQETRETYGKAYLETQYTNATNVSSTSAPSLDPVIDAMVDALLNSRPQTRYLIGGGNGLIDVYCVLARLRDILPTCVMDFLIDKVYSSGVPLKGN
ncbi:D-beta-hydroxybutyrate dehydrogenase, mitochondrial-like [Ylistrum balloti]|uniref:D-beta-hydroxybutyrate dehydrogenase, mitochondrial-like n=1 Tax=Ylistrum balloti TaxID=509963 RepID=UPI002905DF2B|nr:D-beta-hydroxybutyrate dehydrogenase, mitochondrial-like [Ylistrum balloti]